MPLEPLSLRPLGIAGRFHIPERSLGPAAPPLAPLVAPDAEALVARASGVDVLLTRRSGGSIFVNEEVVAAIWGTPRFGSGVAADPGIVAREFALEYRRAGADALRQLHGAFSIAVFDIGRHAGLVALDRMGRNVLYCTQTEDRFSFASSAEMLLASVPQAPEIDPQAILHYLYFHMIPAPDTIYRGIRRLEPGEMIEYRAGQTSSTRYWLPSFDESRSWPFAEAKTAFVSVLERAVRDVCDGGETGCFLSGGTDSSTVAGMLGRVSGSPARTFSIGFAATGYDEMEYARLAARHFGTRHREYYVTPDDVVEAIPMIARAYDQPFGNSSAVPTYFCARLAHGEGVEIMLAGDGGDELFGGNQRYADQYVFSLYERVPGPVKRALLEPAAALPGAGRIVPLRKLKSYIDRAAVPMPKRLEAYNAFERFGVGNMLDPDFMSRVDVSRPATMQNAVYRAAGAHSQINRMLALDFKFTLADNDLRKVGRMCEVAGVDVRYPLLDDAVVAFSLSLPPEFKLRGTKLRYFFKKALQDFLPPQIITKKKQGFGLPFGVWARDHVALRDLAYGSLENLKSRRLVRSEFIDRLIDGHRKEHAAYFGSQIWVLMMLEQWFSEHGIMVRSVSTQTSRAVAG